MYKDKTWEQWDASTAWKYKKDWLAAAKKGGCEYIFEWLHKTKQDEMHIRTVAHLADVTVETIQRKYKLLGFAPNVKGGYRNKKNATGVFYPEQAKGKRWLYVAGEVLYRNGVYVYKLLRCTHCNKILGRDWYTHKEIMALIHAHKCNK